MYRQLEEVQDGLKNAMGDMQVKLQSDMSKADNLSKAIQQLEREFITLTTVIDNQKDAIAAIQRAERQVAPIVEVAREENRIKMDEIANRALELRAKNTRNKMLREKVL